MKEIKKRNRVFKGIYMAWTSNKRKIGEKKNLKKKNKI